jgi:myo-inositol-1(or 4)-monophosphatase
MDHRAERLIVEALARQRSGDAILAEEGSSKPGSTGVRWIIDPLDGTVNYFYGIPAYGVSIAVEVDGTIVAGAVYDGMRGAVHEAVLGHGARSNDIPLRCSDASILAVSLIGTGFAYSAARRAQQGDLVAGLLPCVRDLRRMGAAALDLCAVAGGHLDGFFEHGLQPWDRAAGLLIAAEAGARTARIMDGDEEVTIAAAPGIFDELARALGMAQ